MTVSVSANRSPSSSTRSSTSAVSNASGSPSAAPSTSSHVTGVETVGWGRARTEYTAIVVLCRLFWLQSTSTLPLRRLFFMFETTWSGCARSRSWATARANADACSCVCGVLSGT